MRCRVVQLLAVAALAAAPGAACAIGQEGYEPRLNHGAGIKTFRADGWQHDSEPGPDVSVHVSRARPGADGDSIVRLAAGLTRQLPRDFQVRATVSGQYGRDPLVPGEPAGVGGALVRGFSGRDRENDSGLAANVELYSPQLCGDARWRCRALVFYDKGLIKRNREQGGELRTKAIGSVGMGLRVSLSRDVDLQVDYGHVLRSSQMPLQDKNRLHIRVDLGW